MINMRKLFALAMVVVLASTVALAVVSCGKKAGESSTSSTGTGAMSDSMGNMSSESTMTSPDTTKKK